MSRVAPIIAGFFAVVALACVDLSAPNNEPASISLLRLPELFIVRGDQMRDTNGTPVAPAITAFDGNGNPVTGFTPTFFVTDSNPILSLSSTGVLTAANRIGTGHVIGQIGNVQTPAAMIYVTVTPTTLARQSASNGDTLKLVTGQDSASSIAGFSMPVVVRGGKGTPADTGIGGAIVYYTLVSAPLASRSASLASFLADDSNNPTLVDTTDASGNASRRLVVNSNLMSDSLLKIGKRADSLVVEARMKYRGVNLANSPLRFVIHIKGLFAP